ILATFLLLAGLSPVGAAPEKPTPIIKGSKTASGYHGTVDIWSTPGTRQAAGSFRHGKPDGRWTFWDETGVKVAELTYTNGTFTGPVTLWHGAHAGPREKGRLKYRGAFNDGEWSGLALTYYPDGRTRSERQYEGGAVRETVAFDPRGNPLSPEQANQVAAEDEEQENAYVDALDAYVLRWVQ
ncbi:MAG: hypothetical protein Q8N51_13860, partial [Gammaproteobacteria bacterium]|nr:hypothetical protein [Gammaproteobacteria bacterium]